MIKKNILFAICFMALAGHLSAQEDKDLSITDKDVIKNFEAELAEAKRVRINPKTHTPLDKNLSYDYDITIVPLDLEYPDPKIRPLAKKPDPRLAYNTQWLKLGYGTLKRPIVAFGYQLLLEDQYNFTVKGNYDGGSQGDRLTHRDYSALGLAIDGDYLLNDRFALRSGLSFNQRTASLYGSKLSSNVEKYGTNNQIQKFNFIDFYLGAKNRRSNNNHFLYKLDLNFNTTLVPHEISGLDHSELNLIAPLDINLIIKEGQSFGVKTIADISVATPVEYNDGLLFLVNPYLNTHFNKVQVRLGVSALYNTVSETNKYIFPEIKIAVPFKENKYSAYAGSRMKYQRNNLRNLLSSFPYTEVKSLSSTVYTTRDIYAGFKANVFKLNIDLSAGYRLLDNRVIPQFPLLSDERKNHFTFVNGNSKFLNLSANYQIKSWLRWEGVFDAELFALAQNTKEDFIPKMQFQSKFKGSFLDKKAIVSLTTKYNDALLFDLSEAPTESNYQLDFSIDGKYYFSDNLGAFIEVNNILGQQYQQWYRYADFNRNIAGGVTWRF